MGTSTVKERRRESAEHLTWVCVNCAAETPVTRRRCCDCGTSRY